MSPPTGASALAAEGSQTPRSRLALMTTPRETLASKTMQRDAFAREDELHAAYLACRADAAPGERAELSEAELGSVLTRMLNSAAFIYTTPESQVKDFLWAELNRIDDDDDDDADDATPPPGAPAPSASALHLRDVATEARVFARLTSQYNRFISHCMTMSRLKARNVQRGEEEAGKPKRSNRRSTAFQGNIGADGTVGDTGRELGGYDAIEAASQDLWSGQRRSAAGAAGSLNSERDSHDASGPPTSGPPPPRRAAGEVPTVPAVGVGGESDSD